MRVSQSNSSPVQDAEVSGAKHTGRAHAAKGAKNAEKTEETSAASNSDVNAEISSKGKEFARAKAVAANAPDTREDKIAALKARIAAGKYHVDTDAVADKMVDDHLKAGIG